VGRGFDEELLATGRGFWKGAIVEINRFAGCKITSSAGHDQRKHYKRSSWAF
jgi:hypothetical protein